MEHFDRRQHDREMQDMRDEMKSMQDKLDRIENSIEGLVTAWNTGRGISSFLLGTAKLATAGAVLWALLKNIKWSQIFL